jgi:hypothetical protein
VANSQENTLRPAGQRGRRVDDYPGIARAQRVYSRRTPDAVNFAGGAGIAPFIPEIDAVIPFDVPWMKVDGKAGDSHSVFELVSRLKAERFDGAIIFTVFSQNPLPSALLCYLAEIFRCGSATAVRTLTSC